MTIKICIRIIDYKFGALTEYFHLFSKTVSSLFENSMYQKETHYNGLSVMPSLFQMNITANWGSHGRIAEQIGNLVMQEGWDSYIAYGRWANQSRSHLIRIGSMLDERLHAVETRLFDNHGLASGGRRVH